jgi:hypothetical protein
MEVSPWISRLFRSVVLAGLILLTACGNRFDLSTERGRRARIDEANFLLSQGSCSAALEAISYLYNSPQVDDEVRIITASAHACSGTFNMLTLVGNLSGATNYFSVLAKSLRNIAGEGAPAAFYRATDVLTRNGAALAGSQRSVSVNNYMIFVQLGLIGSILRNYGNPSANGAQQANLIYNTAGSPAGEMSNEDACALGTALSLITDSFANSSLTDGDTTAVNSSLNSVCVSAGLPNCSTISRDRAGCDGTNAQSVMAEAIVGGVNGSW